MKRILIGQDSINLQDLEGIEDGDEVEIEMGGKKVIKKIKNTELFEGQIVRVFAHRPNSYEFGKAGNRHKIHYYSIEDGIKKMTNAKRLDELSDLSFDEIKKKESKDVELSFEELK
ncbi:hypothetical protein CMI37_39365 [Candidatus Pacearchaeota archaeon]|nr:hypothetical protein [Candidatus Pacearchaeota archaeon]|tara:strand:+ start:632 stop:979 length:348 start_codon:yes stop_codon:yes gene_type:complete